VFKTWNPTLLPQFPFPVIHANFALPRWTSNLYFLYSMSVSSPPRLWPLANSIAVSGHVWPFTCKRQGLRFICLVGPKVGPRSWYINQHLINTLNEIEIDFFHIWPSHFTDEQTEMWSDLNKITCLVSGRSGTKIIFVGVCSFSANAFFSSSPI
jgi:hypothetical protein